MLINEGLYRQVHGNTLYNYSQNTVKNKYSIYRLNIIIKISNVKINNE